MYRVVIHRRAARYLKKLSKYQKNKIRNILSKLENQPFDLPGVKHMVGDWSGYHRMRVCNTRIIFYVDKKEHIVYVDHIGPRGDIYK